MKKFAFVAEGGDIKYIINSNDYVDGDTWNFLTIVEIQTELSDSEFAEKKYWKQGAWHDKPIKPDGLYIWEGHQWFFDQDTLLISMRSVRDNLLLKSDWTQMPDAPLTEAKRAEWVAYRQALRDVPQDNQSATSINDIIWPTKPE
jgi:hypothetical protein